VAWWMISAGNWWRAKVMGCIALPYLAPSQAVYLRVTCVDARLGARRIFWIGVARRRVRTCVRPLVRPITGRGPGWEFADQLQFNAARSKHFVTVWLS